jgi:2'-5' RNA ligase
MEKAAEKRERLFIGVPLSDDARRAIGKSLPKSLPGKVVPPENWHFTLRFLGATPADTRDQIVRIVKAATCGAPFTIRFTDLGAFPHAGRARILWLGIDEGTERMKQLAAIAEAAARNVGFVGEGREFTPHLTLSRIEPPTSVKTLLTSKIEFGHRMAVDSVILYRSRLGGGPTRYEEVERFALVTRQ